MLAALTRALCDRAADVARWEFGSCETTEPTGLYLPSERRAQTAEFRVTVPGPVPTTYVVTVAEVPCHT